MARLNKLDCEYTLEEAKKDVDENDITKHPFFKKHFASSPNVKGYFGSSKYAKPDKDQDHVIHYIIHTPLDPYHESNIDHAKHAVKIETQHYGKTRHIGHGRGRTVHEAMNVAIHTYKHPVEIKPLTESLVGKKPATAFKLFAEGMEARLDEISKKTLGRYIERAVVDRDRHIENATQARASADALSNVRADSDAAAQTKRTLRSYLGDQEREAHAKKHKREYGVLKALDRLTKEDLDESMLNKDYITNHPFFKKHFENGAYRHVIDKHGSHHEYLTDKYGKHVIRHFPSSAENPGHVVEVATLGHNGQDVHFGSGHGRTAHDALDLALTKYHADAKKHRPLDESLVAISEVEAPANFWNAGMAKMNPIQVSQKQPAEPGQFKATLTKSPKRLADQGSSLEGKPRAVRDETKATAISRGPKTIELTGDWHADVPDHQFDPKLDSETEYYPLFSQFKAMGAYPSGPARAWESEEIDEDELNEISKKTLGRYIERAANSKMMAGVRSQEAPIDSEEEKKQLNKIRTRSHGISRAVKKLTEDSASLMATATKDEKKAAEQDKKKPSEFKKFHDKHETEVKAKMKELGEETLDEGLFDPAKQPLLALWDEHARRTDAHGSGSRNEILKRIEDHVAKKHGQEGLKKMRLHTDLTNALKHSLSPDKGHLQSILGNMRSRCSMGA